MLAEILAYNKSAPAYNIKSALCRSVSHAFRFVSFYTSIDVWLQHLLKLEIRQQEPVSFISALRGPLASHADVLRGSSRVPAPPLGTSAGEDSGPLALRVFTNLVPRVLSLRAGRREP